MFRRTFSFKAGDRWWIILFLEGFTQYIQKSGTTSLTSTTQWWVYRSTLKKTCNMWSYPPGSDHISPTKSRHILSWWFSSHFSLRSWGYRPREELWLFQCGSPKARRVAMLPGPAPCTWVLEAAGGWYWAAWSTLKEGNIMIQPNKREEVLRVFSWLLLSQVHYDIVIIVFRLLVCNRYVVLPVLFLGFPASPSSTPHILNSQTPSLSPGSSSGRGFTTDVMTTNSLIRDDSWRFCFCFFWGGAFGKGKETRCSFWMEIVLVVVIVLIGKKPCWSWVFGHPLLVPLGASQPEVFVFSGRVVQVF